MFVGLRLGFQARRIGENWETPIYNFDPWFLFESVRPQADVGRWERTDELEAQGDDGES